MPNLIRHIRNSLPEKISLSMFCVVLLVFILANGISMALAKHYFHPVAMDHASEALNTAVAKVERYVRSGDISPELSLPEISRVLSSVKPYPHSYMMVLGQDGTYYVHPDTSRIGVKTIFDPTSGQYYPDKITLGHEMTSGHSGVMHADVAGVHSLICYQPIPGTQWSAALVSPEKDVLKEFRTLDKIILLIVLLVLLFIYIICRNTVVRAFAPMKLLEEQARRITDGDYSTVIPAGNANSVIGTLQNSFAHMQEVLRNHILEINHKNEESARRNDEVQKANTALEEALRRQSNFVANMTHQIRTPLNLIQGFSQLLRSSDGIIAPDEFKRILHVMDYHSMILNRMAMMLYDSSDRGYHDEVVSLSYDIVSPNEVARECLDYTKRYFPDVTVAFETSLEDSFTIVTDHLYMMRSVREMLYNSAKYSDGKNVTMRLTANKSRVRFEFEDTGDGISPEYQEHVFTPFYKWNNLSEGLGIGLPLTKRHVILLGGRLELDGDYRKGCRFIMEFPLEAPTS